MTIDSPLAPHEEYGRRLTARRDVAQALARRERQTSNARLLAFITAVAVVWLAIDTQICSPWWGALPLLGFVVLVVTHHRARRDRERAERAATFYERGVARLEDCWAGGGGEFGERFQDPTHPYAEDLDLFGRGSLFELLCTARTRAGEETLAAWLKTPAPPDEIRARQAAIDELRPRIDLREDLWSIGIDVRRGLHADTLAAWGAEPLRFHSPMLRVVALLLATMAVATLAGWALLSIGPRPFLAIAIGEAALGLALRARVIRVIRAVERPAHELSLLAALLARLEREHFTSPRLVALRATLDTAGMPPSERVARLNRWIDLLDARRNELFAPITPVLLWATQCALAIEAWRAQSGPAIARWLSTVGEVEALCALAAYAYEHPDDVFPELTANGASFVAISLGHPLIPAARCVRNDVELGGNLRVLVVSGSNMSGKSTLLRTVGINAVLALMGAPVRAQRVELSPLAIGASIRAHDSLQAGTSRFYEEISRLRQLVDLTAQPLPLLFLLDEVLAGTNSHDRRIGAEAVVQGFVARGAIGLVTTHDLALAGMADGMRAVNVHFEDHIEDGRMVFDYRMRPGVVEKSNALALMRAIGLEV